MIERNVGRVQLSLYAARSYVDRRLRGGRVRREDFPRLEFIGNEELTGHPHQDWLIAQGAKRFVVRSNSDAAIFEAAVQGQGIALLGQPIARGLPDLVRLDADVAPPTVPIYLAYHRELRNVPRVRLVLAALDAAIREGLR